MSKTSVQSMLRAGQLGGAVALALSWPLSVEAADARSGGLEEVIVTAQKRAESLQDVPIAISAFGAEAIRNLGIRSTNDLVRFTPNLIWAPSGGVGSNVGMRGVVDVNFTTSQVGSVGVIVDEVALNSPVLNTFALFDVDRIEVLRGPQVTLYGRSTTGGAVNIITRRPLVEDGTNGRAVLTVANDGVIDVDGAVGFAVSDRTAVRIAAVSQTRDGIFRNPTLNTEDSDRDRQAGRLSVTSKFGETGELFAMVVDGRSRGQSLRYKSVGLLLPDGDGTQFCTNPSLGSGCVDIEGFADSDDFDTVYADFPNPIEDVEVQGAALNLGWDAGPTRITSITAWVQNSVARSEDTDGGPFAIADVHIDADTDQYSQEFRVASRDDAAALRWLAGVLYMKETQLGVTAALRRLASDITPPVSFTALGYDQDDEMYSAYGQLDYRFNDQWSATLGGRFSSEQKSGTAERMRTFAFDTSRFPAVGTHVNLSRARQIGDPEFYTRVPFDQTWDNWGGKLGLNFALDDDTLFYGSISQGFKGGTFNFAAAAMFRGAPGDVPAGQPAFQRGVEPEELTTYEIGAKTRFDDLRAEINVAVFYNDYKDQQVFGFDSNGVLVLRNAASSTAQGIEAELRWQPVDGFLLQLGGGYIDGEYDRFVLDDSVDPPVVADGNRMILTPEFTANALARKSWAIAAGEASFQLSAAYTGEQYFEADNPPQTRESAHTTVDARLGYAFGADNAYEIAVFGRNLGDERFCLNSGTIPWGQAQCSPNEPRSVGITASVQF
jgi:iron complex outermembrane recepter protein